METKQYAIALPDYYFVYNQWLYSFGTGFLNDEYNEVTFDSKESIELMQFLADCVAKGYAPVPDKNYDYLQQLIDGHVAMTNAGRWMLKYCSSKIFTTWRQSRFRTSIPIVRSMLLAALR